MGAPTVYRYDDNNAPVLSGTIGSLVRVLKSILIDGYGDKSAAGWTMPYADAINNPTVAVFRNNHETGSGFCIKLDGTSPNMTAVQGYEDVVDINSGVFPFAPDGLRITHSATGNTTPRPWIVVADDRMFFITMFIYCNTNTAPSSFVGQGDVSNLFFGDGIPISPSDNYFCIMSGSYNSNSDAVAFSESGHNRYNNCYAARKINGEPGIIQCNINYGGGPMQYECGRGNTQGAARISGAEIFSRPLVNNGSVYSVRGYVPGLWYPCHNGRSMTNMEIVDCPPHRFLVFVYGGGDYRFTYAIDISDNFRP